MMRVINAILVLTSVLALVAVYLLKFSVEDTAVRKAGLQTRIERQTAELSLLQADWALLNQPGHVDPVITRHAEVLDLAPVKQAQFNSFTRLPMRPAPAEPDKEALDQLFESLDSGIDPAGAPLGGN